MIRLLFLMFIPFSLMGQDVSCLLKKAECAKNNDALKRAIRLYTKAIELDSLNSEAYSGRASAKYFLWVYRGELKRDSMLYASVISDLTKSNEIDSSICWVNVMLADYYMDKDEHGIALKYYNNAIDYCYTVVNYYFKRAFCFMQLGDFYNAKIDYNTGIELIDFIDDEESMRSMKSSYLCYKAICNIKLGNLDHARENLYEAKILYTTKFLPDFLLASIDALNGEYLNAIERYTSIVEKNSLLAIVYLHIGNSYMLLGFSDQAEKYWSTAKNMGININDKSKTIESAIDLIINGYKLK